MQLNTTELAKHLGVTKGRISQLVANGQLEGCYSGDGRQRRFNLKDCAVKLNRKLDPGQMLGNGASTRQRLKEISKQEPVANKTSNAANDDDLPKADPDRYELARTQKAEEEARRLRRLNLEAEGTFVLAANVQHETMRILAQELAQIETMLREAARSIADKYNLDFLEVKKNLSDQWREYRSKRSNFLADQAEIATMTKEETAQDF